MKKIFLSLILTLSSIFIYGQTNFDKFDGPEEITTVVVNKKMFEMMGNVKTSDSETQRFLKLIKGLDNLKVYSTRDKKWSNEFKNSVDSYLKSNSLDELMRVNESGKNVKIYINKTPANTTKINELLMFIDGGIKEETVLLSLTGVFELNDISMLVDRMKLPGGNALQKASKK